MKNFDEVLKELENQPPEELFKRCVIAFGSIVLANYIIKEFTRPGHSKIIDIIIVSAVTGSITSKVYKFISLRKELNRLRKIYGEENDSNNKNDVIDAEVVNEETIE